jgi:hypothetical protein
LPGTAIMISRRCEILSTRRGREDRRRVGNAPVRRAAFRNVVNWRVAHPTAMGSTESIY